MAMRLKNEGDSLEARIVDKDGDMLLLRLFPEDKSGFQMILRTGSGAAVGMKRKKAIAFAEAILKALA